MTRIPLMRPRKPPGERLITHASSETVAALNAWISSQPNPKPSRSGILRMVLEEWLIGRGLLKKQEDRENLDQHIHRLEGEISHLKEQAAAEPSPATGMAMLRKAKVKNEIVKAKNKRGRAK